MTLDDIPEGATVTLTAELTRLFKYAGCDPTCHACLEAIEVGEVFKLTMYRRDRFGGHSFKRDEKPSDVMLCGECTVEDLARREMNNRRRRARYMADNPRAGYSRPSKVTVSEGLKRDG